MKITFMLLPAFLCLAWMSREPGATITAEEEPVRAESQCPEQSGITGFNALFRPYAYMNKWNLSEGKNIQAGIYQDRGELKIWFTNKSSLTAAQMNNVLKNGVPVEKTGEYIFVLHLSNAKGKIVAGDYLAANKFGEMNATVEVMHRKEGAAKGHVTPLMPDSGQVSISNLTKNRVCGTFDLQGSIATIKGSFNVPLRKL